MHASPFLGSHGHYFLIQEPVKQRLLTTSWYLIRDRNIFSSFNYLETLSKTSCSTSTKRSRGTANLNHTKCEPVSRTKSLSYHIPANLQILFCRGMHKCYGGSKLQVRNRWPWKKRAYPNNYKDSYPQKIPCKHSHGLHREKGWKKIPVSTK